MRKALETHSTGWDRKVAGLEDTINDLCRRMGRPGGAEGNYEPGLERKNAVTMCRDRQSWLHQKQDGQRIEYEPSAAEIQTAIRGAACVARSHSHWRFRPLNSRRAEKPVGLPVRQFGLDDGTAGQLPDFKLFD